MACARGRCGAPRRAGVLGRRPPRPAAPTGSAGSPRWRSAAATSTGAAASTRPREWSFGANGIYSNLLLRTLVGYDHVAGAAGYRLVPDLAETVPAPTDGGLVYRFTLRRGVRFGPPVRRAVTSSDIRYAIERLARPSSGAQYAWRLTMIAGYDAYRAGRARSISGIATPDARTIVFRLTRPTADFPHRLTLPATAPIPVEVARCFEGKPGAYGARPRRDGPVHDRRRGRRQREVVRRAEADARLHRLPADARPEPELRPADRQPRGARERSRPVRVSDRRPGSSCSGSSTPASSRTSTSSPARPRSRGTRPPRRGTACSGSTRRTSSSSSRST